MTIHRIFSVLKNPKTLNSRSTPLDLVSKMNEAFDIALVTANWDAQAEWCLNLLNLPFHFGVDEITATTRTAPGGEIPVLKLHGCTNQGYCDCCRCLIRFEGFEDALVNLDLLLEEEDFRSFEGGEPFARILRKRKTHTMYAGLRLCRSCNVRISARVATFSYRKDLNAHAFYTIWDKAQTGLQLAAKWLFVGYSLPEADIEIRHLLKSAQLARKDPATLCIDIVLKEDGEAGERYKRFFGLTDEKIFQEGLAEWIAKNLNDYCE